MTETQRGTVKLGDIAAERQRGREEERQVAIGK